MRRSRRRLPHWDSPGTATFVTWRLWGSLPRERPPVREPLTSGDAFAAFDEMLDTAGSGPVYLGRPEIANMVREQLRQTEAGGLCCLHTYVVMPNHVHLLWTPRVSLSFLIQRVKGTTAFRANQLLKRTGEPFWQPEYFDRLVRDEGEFARIRRYIEWNPVKGGLVARPEEYPWSSAWGRD